MNRTPPRTNEQDNEGIRSEFKRRDSAGNLDLYSLTRDVNLFFYQGRVRHALSLLRRGGFFPCTKKTVLEIGCGARGWLPDFEAWGVPRASLAGIDLEESRVCLVQRLLSGYCDQSGSVIAGGADVRIGDAACLPWPSSSFDALVQSTVFTSIPSESQRTAIAGEMLRVVKPDGLILWYDFVYNNPRNPNVRGIGLREIKRLFPGCSFQSKLVTLAPPLARVIVPFSWLLGELLQAARFLNTHRLVVIKKQQ